MTDFSKTRDLFYLPEGKIYLDGNSLGPLPLAAEAATAEFLRNQWGEELIKGWNSRGWFNAPNTLGDRLGRLIGAPSGTTVVGNTLSIKVFQALAAALALVPERRVILSDTGNFPTDLYMAEGLMKLKNDGYQLKLVAPESVLASIDETIAVVSITEVDFCTGRKHDMAAIIKKAHSVGALVVWDLAHSAGAIPVDVTAADTDFAVGCTYKYINGGPGAPAFIYVAPRYIETVEPALAGWHGHAAPFAFDLEYRAANNIERMRIGTPPVVFFPILGAALDIWEQVDMGDIRAQSIRLTELFRTEIESRCPALSLASPINPDERGSQICFHFEHGYAAMRALIDQGLIGDFRAPDILRFGIAPLYNNEADIRGAIDIIEDMLARELWKKEEYQTRLLVT